MPSKSAKQARLMAAASDNAAFAKRAGVPQSVARDFNRADKKVAMARKRLKNRSALHMIEA